jgi:hypothetical protein
MEASTRLSAHRIHGRRVIGFPSFLGVMLVASTITGAQDIAWATGTVVRATPGNNSFASQGSISRDGRYVAFDERRRVVARHLHI